jgi:hypothetical protein
MENLLEEGDELLDGLLLQAVGESLPDSLG